MGLLEAEMGENQKLLVIGMISLFFIIVLVVLLHIYARYKLRLHQRLRFQASITSPTTDIDHAVELGTINDPNEPSKKGLDPSVIASLPIFVYQATDGTGGGDGLECSVCLSTIEEGDNFRSLPNCKHNFHAECIDMWLSSHTTCPICRTGAEPQPAVEPTVTAAVTAAPTAPPLEESSSDGGARLQKVGGSGSRLSSFRRILSWERSSRRIQNRGDEEGGAENI